MLARGFGCPWNESTCSLAAFGERFAVRRLEDRLTKAGADVVSQNFAGITVSHR